MKLKNVLFVFTILLANLAIFVPLSGVDALQGEGNPDSSSLEMQAEQKREEAKKNAEQAKEDAQRLAEQKREEAKQLAEQKREEAKKQAESALEQKKVEFKAKTVEQKQKACESVSDRLNSSLDNGSSVASKLKSGFDTHFTNIENFYIKMGLFSVNHDTLLEQAQLAGTNAQASVDALDSFKFKVDCSNVETSTSNVAAFKEAMNKARTDLNSYRVAVKAFLNDVKIAAESAEKAVQQ